MRMRYGWANLTILTAGTVVSAALIPYVGWVYAGAAGGARLSEDLDVLAVVLVLPAFLLGWRWPRLSAYALWTLLLCVVVFAVTARQLAPMLIPMAAVAGVAGLASWLESRERGAGQGAAE